MNSHGRYELVRLDTRAGQATDESHGRLIDQLPDVERSAASLFRSFAVAGDGGADVGYIADDEPMDPIVHQLLALDGRNNGVGGTYVALVDPPGSSSTVEGRGRDGRIPDREVAGFVVTELLESSRRSPSPCSVSDDGPEEPKRKEREREDEKAGGAVGSRERNTGEGVSLLLLIRELSVHAAHQRRGLARRLLQVVEDDVRNSNRAVMWEDGGRTDDKGGPDEGKKTRVTIVGLCLTTFRDLPFNAPFYRTFGFLEVSEPAAISGDSAEEVVRLWDDEQAHFQGMEEKLKTRSEDQDRHGKRSGEGVANERTLSLAARRCFMVKLYTLPTSKRKQPSEHD